MIAAENILRVSHPMPDDSTATACALRRQGGYGALKGIVGMLCAVHRYSEGVAVFVSALLAFRHLILLIKWARARISWSLYVGRLPGTAVRR